MSYAEKAQSVLGHIKVHDSGFTIDASAPIYVLNIMQAIVSKAEDHWSMKFAYDVIIAASELTPEDTEDSVTVRKMIDHLSEPRFTGVDQAVWWMINRPARSLRQSMSDALAETDSETAIEVIHHAERSEREQLAMLVLSFLKQADECTMQEITFACGHDNDHPCNH